jgi:hypothetical protein
MMNEVLSKVVMSLTVNRVPLLSSQHSQGWIETTYTLLGYFNLCSMLVGNF